MNFQIQKCGQFQGQRIRKNNMLEHWHDNQPVREQSASWEAGEEGEGWCHWREGVTCRCLIEKTGFYFIGGSSRRLSRFHDTFSSWDQGHFSHNNHIGEGQPVSWSIIQSYPGIDQSVLAVVANFGRAFYFSRPTVTTVALDTALIDDLAIESAPMNIDSRGTNGIILFFDACFLFSSTWRSHGWTKAAAEVLDNQWK